MTFVLSRNFCLHSNRYGTEPRRSLLQNMQRRCTIKAVIDAQQDFIQEMKTVSMKLHSKPKQGEAPAFTKWVYTLEGFIRHLVEARVIYKTFEKIINSNDQYLLLRDSGLDRAKALDNDIAWVSTTYDLPIPEAKEDGAGHTYANILRETSETNEALFLCHYYNYYLAHTAGGKFIGKKVADTLLNGAFDKLAYYRYDTDVKALVANLKSNMNTMASSWTRAEKDICLEETPNAFKYSGTILGTLFEETN